MIHRTALLLALTGCATPNQLLHQAHQDAKAGRFAPARTKLEAALRRAPHHQEACILLSQLYCLYKTEIPPPAEAVAVLEEVAAQRAQAFEVTMRLATHYAKSQPSRAADYLLQYFAHRPGHLSASDPFVRDLLIKSLQASRRWAEADQQAQLQRGVP